ERAVGIERTHRDLVQFFRAALIAVARKTGRIVARAEAVDHQRHIALSGPKLAPRLMALRERGGVVEALRGGRIRPGAAMHHHDGGRACGMLALREIEVSDQCGLAVIAWKSNALRALAWKRHALGPL